MHNCGQSSLPSCPPAPPYTHLLPGSTARLCPVTAAACRCHRLYWCPSHSATRAWGPDPPRKRDLRPQEEQGAPVDGCRGSRTSGRSAPSVGGVGPWAQQQGDMELVGLVCDGENDLRTEAPGGSTVPSAPLEKPDCGPRAGSQGASERPAPGDWKRAVDKTESALNPGPARLPKVPTLKQVRRRGCSKVRPSELDETCSTPVSTEAESPSTLPTTA